MIDVQIHDGIHVLRVQNGENRFNPDTIAQWNEALDHVERAQPRALVTTGDGKFFSNGLDLEWAKRNEARVPELRRAGELLVRLLTFPAITVAAVNGHAFAAGAILSLVHDFSVMRSGRGFFCLPEVDIEMAFSVSMAMIVRSKVPQPAAHEAIMTCRRYTAEEAAQAGIVSASAPEDQVLPRALELARKLGGKPPKTLGGVKRAMYHDVVAALAHELQS